jgi:hypothetical protein
MVLPDYSTHAEYLDFTLAHFHINYEGVGESAIPLNKNQISQLVDSLVPYLEKISDLAVKIRLSANSEHVPLSDASATDENESLQAQMKSQFIQFLGMVKSCDELLNVFLPQIRILTTEAQAQLRLEMRAKSSSESEYSPPESVDILVDCAMITMKLKFALESLLEHRPETLEKFLTSSEESQVSEFSQVHPSIRQLSWVYEQSQSLIPILAAMFKEGAH